MLPSVPLYIVFGILQPEVGREVDYLHAPVIEVFNNLVSLTMRNGCEDKITRVGQLVHIHWREGDVNETFEAWVYPVHVITSFLPRCHHCHSCFRMCNQQPQQFDAN